MQREGNARRASDDRKGVLLDERRRL